MVFASSRREQEIKRGNIYLLPFYILFEEKKR